MECHYSPLNAGNRAVGEDIKSTRLNHLGVLQNDIQDTIKCHQQLEGKALYLYIASNPKERYEFISIHI